MAIGRLIKIKNKETDWGWGVFLNFQHRKNNKKSNKESIYVLDVMLHTKPRKKNELPLPALLNEQGDMEVIPVFLESLVDISSVKLNLPVDLKTKENKLLVKSTIKKISDQFEGHLPLIDPVKDMHLNDEELDKSMDKVKGYTEKLTKIKANLKNSKEDHI